MKYKDIIAGLPGPSGSLSRGEPINSHVVPDIKEPKPDYEAMRKIVHGVGAETDQKDVVQPEPAEGD